MRPLRIIYQWKFYILSAILSLRAQSVRRTSLRDKTLTTKKDAAEETRLRLQAQDVFAPAPDSTTLDPNGPADHNMESAADWLSKSAATNSHHNHQHHHTSSINNNNTLKMNNNHRNSYDPSLQDYVDSTTTQSSSAAVAAQQQHHHHSQYQPQHSYQPRRPPEGRENDELQMQAFKSNGEQHSTGDMMTGGTTTTSASAAVIAATTRTTGQTEAVQIQSSKEAANGKINVQVTVLVGKC